MTEGRKDTCGEGKKPTQASGSRCGCRPAEQPYLGVGAPGQLRLDDHHHDAEHAEDERVVAEALPLLEERPAVSQLVADVLVLLLARLAAAVGLAASAAAAGSVERQVVGVVVLGLGHHDLRAGGGGTGTGVRRRRRRRLVGLQRLRLGVQLVEVPAGRAQVAERAHDAAVVPAAAHGYFREGVALPARRRRRLLLLGLGVLGVVVRVVVVAAAADTAGGAARLLGLLHAMALVVEGVVVGLVGLGVVVGLPGRTGMAGRGQLAHVELAALARGGCGAGERRGASPESARQGRRSAEQQGQVISRRSRRSPIVGAVVALKAWTDLLLLLLVLAGRLLLLLLWQAMRVCALLLLLVLLLL